eukprot:g44767.t1
MKQSKIVDKDTFLPDVLNTFYAWFEQNASSDVDVPVPTVTTADVGLVFLGVNPRKTTGLDGVPSQAPRSCAHQLAEVFTNIFNLSLLQAEVPTCFRKTTIIPVPKKAHATCLNDYSDDTTVVGQIPNNDASEYRKELEGLVTWCSEPLNVGKTAELIIDFRKKGGEHAPIYINGAEVERVESGKFLGQLKDEMMWCEVMATASSGIGGSDQALEKSQLNIK